MKLTKRLFWWLLIVLLFCIPSVTALAASNQEYEFDFDFNMQTGENDEIFLRHDEFCEIFRLTDTGKDYRLKNEFKPYYNKFLEDVIWNNIYDCQEVIYNDKTNKAYHLFDIGTFYFDTFYFDTQRATSEMVATRLACESMIAEMVLEVFCNKYGFDMLTLIMELVI